MLAGGLISSFDYGASASPPYYDFSLVWITKDAISYDKQVLSIHKLCFIVVMIALRKLRISCFGTTRNDVSTN